MTSHTEKTEDILAQLTAARTEIDRLLTLTSEQATEIERLKAKVDKAYLAGIDAALSLNSVETGR